MAHDHHHGDPGAFYMEQLLTIGVCAAFGGVVLMLCGPASLAPEGKRRLDNFNSGVLKNMLAQKFHIWVFLGGAELARHGDLNAVAVWFSVGEAKAVPD